MRRMTIYGKSGEVSFFYCYLKRPSVMPAKNIFEYLLIKTEGVNKNEHNLKKLVILN